MLNTFQKLSVIWDEVDILCDDIYSVRSKNKAYILLDRLGVLIPVTGNNINYSSRLWDILVVGHDNGTIVINTNNLNYRILTDGKYLIAMSNRNYTVLLGNKAQECAKSLMVINTGNLGNVLHTKSLIHGKFVWNGQELWYFKTWNKGKQSDLKYITCDLSINEIKEIAGWI